MDDNIASILEFPLVTSLMPQSTRVTDEVFQKMKSNASQAKVLVNDRLSHLLLGWYGF